MRRAGHGSDQTTARPLPSRLLDADQVRRRSQREAPHARHAPGVHVEQGKRGLERRALDHHLRAVCARMQAAAPQDEPWWVGGGGVEQAKAGLVDGGARGAVGVHVGQGERGLERRALDHHLRAACARMQAAAPQDEPWWVGGGGVEQAKARADGWWRRGA
jgi:hypothetical protein